MAKSSYRIIAESGVDLTPPLFYRLKRSAMSRQAQQIADDINDAVSLINDTTGNWWNFSPKE